VLVTQLVAETFRTIVLDCKRRNGGGTSSLNQSVDADPLLGTLWQSERIGYKHELKEQPCLFKISAMQAKWESFSGQLVGTTVLTDEEIQVKGPLSSHSALIVSQGNL
jgi:hypothetical protein